MRLEVVDDIKLKFLMKFLQTCTEIYFKFNTGRVCHVCAKEFWGRLSLQHLKIHEGIEHKCDKCR